jgi:pimeloyl-ACP methyl ester carboxylesterase
MNFSPEKKSIVTDKGDIYYFTAGPEESDQAVILLHGLSSNHTTWLTLMEKLAAQGIRSIAPDLRGHGFSDKSKKKDWYALSIFTKDVRQIIEKERLQKFDMVGYSFGGYIALAYAAENPETLRSLALVSTNFMNPLHYGPFSAFAKASSAFCNAMAWLTYPQRRRHYYYFEQGKSTGYFNSTFTGFLTMPFSVNLWMLARVAQIDFSESLSLITCPTLIVRSITDPYLTEREVADMSQKMKNAHTVTIAGDGHFLASRNQDDLAKKILPFLAGSFTEIKRKNSVRHTDARLRKTIQYNEKRTSLKKMISGISSKSSTPRHQTVSRRSLVK